LEVSTIGQLANETLHLEKNGWVHSIFEHTVNLLLPSSELICITELSLFDPWTAIVKDKIDFNNLGLKEDMPFSYRLDVLKIEDVKLNFDLSGVNIYKNTKNFVSPPLNKWLIYRNLEKLRAFCGVCCPDAGLAPLIWYISDNSEHGNIDNLNSTALMALPRILCLIEKMKLKDLKGISRATDSLVGLGPGLTPSADDMFRGIISVFNLLGSCMCTGGHVDTLRQINRCIFTSAAGKTNLISQKMLEHALEGQIPRIMHDLVLSFLEVDNNLIQKCLDVGLYGKTSGFDYLLGVAIGMSLISETNLVLV